MPDRLTFVDINLQHYTHNISEVMRLLPDGVKTMTVIKANAYGHGIEEIAKAATAAGAAYLGVVSLGELKQVRMAGIQTPVLILNYLDPASVSEAIKYDASITVMDEMIIPAIAEAASAQSKTVNVHIKIDTGMHRAGCDPSDVLKLVNKVESMSHMYLEGVFTHFAESESLDRKFTDKQLKVFRDSIDQLKAENINPPLLHCANSAAIISHPESHFTMVRPGLISYGLNPFPKEHDQHKFVETHFKPVLSLKTQIAFIRSIEAGETVGYNRRWQAQRGSTLALLPIGYGDGYRRTPYNANRVLINGQYACIVGSVAMDQTVVDITNIEGAISAGDEVIIIGEQNGSAITADDIAAAYETINYEVVTSLAGRISRVYFG